MGENSRDTFNELKNYVSVRLQEAVPLVDADWNEMNDIIRHELYNSLSGVFADGIIEGFELGESKDSNNVIKPNDFVVHSGKALLKGRYSALQQDIAYAGQPGSVALQTPGQDRTDLVYLDVFEREVTSREDPNLINNAIGIETCVRMKREVVIRVQEGSMQVPAPVPDGHIYFPLAMLHRKANQDTITKDQFEDRPVFHPRFDKQYLIVEGGTSDRTNLELAYLGGDGLGGDKGPEVQLGSFNPNTTEVILYNPKSNKVMNLTCGNLTGHGAALIGIVVPKYSWNNTVDPGQQSELTNFGGDMFTISYQTVDSSGNKSPLIYHINGPYHPYISLWNDDSVKKWYVRNNHPSTKLLIAVRSVSKT